MSQPATTHTVTPLTVEQRAELKHLAEAATPGPYDRYSEDDGNFAEARVDWEVVGPARFYDENQMADASYYQAATPEAVRSLLAALSTAEATAEATAGPFALGMNQTHQDLQHDYFTMKQRAIAAELRGELAEAKASNADRMKLLSNVLGLLQSAWKEGSFQPVQGAISLLKRKLKLAPACPGNCPTCEKAEPWQAVFASQEEYDASVADVCRRIASGEITPRQVELNSTLRCVLCDESPCGMCPEHAKGRSASPLQGKKGGVEGE